MCQLYLRLCLPCHWFVGGHRVRRWLIRPDDWIFNLFAVSGWLGVRCHGLVGGHGVHNRHVRSWQCHDVYRVS